MPGGVPMGYMLSPMWMGPPMTWQAAGAPGQPPLPWSWPPLIPSRQSSKSRSKGRGKDRGGHGDSAHDGETVRIPRNIMGRVIGKQGITINEIREKTGARIDAEDKSNGECEFRLRGSDDAVQKAKAMIQEVADKATLEGDSVIMDGGSSETLEFAVTAAGVIIGSKGAKISEVRQQSGAKVQVEKLERACKVKISGTPQQIEEAKTLIQKIVEDDEKAADADGKEGEDGRVSETLSFPVNAIGGIIGARGAKIGEVRQHSGAHIKLEKLEDKCLVAISGNAEQVQKAKEMVTELVEGASDAQGHPPAKKSGEAEDVMDVPQSLLGRVIGKGGETIQRLQRESRARITVPQGSGDPCPVRMSGSRDAVARARFMLAEVIDRGSLPERRDGRDEGFRPPIWPAEGCGAWPAGSLGWPPPPLPGAWPGMPMPSGANPWHPPAMQPDRGRPPSRRSQAESASTRQELRQEKIDLDEL